MKFSRLRVNNYEIVGDLSVCKVSKYFSFQGYACPWPRHVLEYWERRNDKNVLFLRYEDVIKVYTF